MVRKIDWDSQIGRRLKLRDLHVFSTVVDCGSMAKAARHLGVSTPAVSEVIGDLEHVAHEGRLRGDAHADRRRTLRRLGCSKRGGTQRGGEHARS